MLLSLVCSGRSSRFSGGAGESVVSKKPAVRQGGRRMDCKGLFLTKKEMSEQIR